MSNTINCKLTGQALGFKLDGGLCVCTEGNCKMEKYEEQAIADANKRLGNPGRVATLVTAGTDAEYAAELKARAIKLYEPLLEMLTEASNRGFSVNIGCGPGPLGNYVIVQMQIMKMFK